MEIKSFKNIAYEYLYDNIINYKILPGTPIVEQEISNILGISRTPVREALKHLEAKGLIKHIPKRGTFVNEISMQDIEEIFAIREALESYALKTSIHTIPNEEIEVVEKQLNSLGDKSSFEDFYESDRKLHDLIVKYGYNKRLDNILINLNAQIEKLRHISATIPKRLESSKQEHIEIIEALKARNLEKTSELLTEHIRNVKMNVLNIHNIHRSI